jgi:DNA-binding NarL/FixJ family response regulator
MTESGWLPGTPDVRRLLEAIYAFEELDVKAWLTRIREAVVPSLPGALEVCVDIHRIEEGKPKFVAMVPSGAEFPAPPEQVLSMPPVGYAPTLVESGKEGLKHLVDAGVLPEMPRDIFTLATSDGRTGGLICAALPEQGAELTQKQHDNWMRISAHLGAAIRLRLLGLPKPDLRLDSSLKVVDALGDAKDQATREALRLAARGVDQVRSRKVKDPEEALSLWRVLNERRWTIAEDFDSDGRRYVVAYENAPLPNMNFPKLTLGEKQVVCFAALGHTNKHIGYELGIATSTVATRLATAMKKLGVKSRPALVRKLNEGSVSVSET